MKVKMFLLAMFITVSYPMKATGQFSLWWVEKRLAMKYSVANMSFQELKDKLSSKRASEYLIFDTRQKEEYDTSHIQSAMHVDPQMSAETFIETYEKRIKGKHLVFYCSVGDRSSSFIERVQQQALKKGAASLSNLRGGIFRWYNEHNPVVDSKGETDAIHPYDEEWGKLIIKRDRNKWQGSWKSDLPDRIAVNPKCFDSQIL